MAPRLCGPSHPGPQEQRWISSNVQHDSAPLRPWRCRPRAQPVITRGIPPKVHWPVEEWLTVTVEAKGTGTLAYQWYKGPAQSLTRADKSPCRLDGQTSDTLAMECLANGGGEYWVEVTDTADHGRSSKAPCSWCPASGWTPRAPRSVSWPVFAGAGPGRDLLRAPAAAARVRLAGSTSKVIQGLSAGPSGLRPARGRATWATGPGPSAVWTESKAMAVSVAMEPLFLDRYDDMPALEDLPGELVPH